MGSAAKPPSPDIEGSMSELNIHPLVEDAHDLDAIVGAATDIDRVRLQEFLAIAHLDRVDRNGLRGAGGEVVAGGDKGADITVGLGLVPAFRR